MSDRIKRLLIAVNITDELINDLSSIKAKLEGEIFGKWVRPESIHLTLKFLGNLSPTKVDDTIAIIKKSVSGVRAFNVKTTELGCFPNNKRARVLWLGLEDDERLRAIKREIEVRASALGFEEDTKEYRPHLTLARLNNKRVDIDVINEKIEIVRQLPVDRVTLFESILSRSGARYYSVESIELLS